MRSTILGHSGELKMKTIQELEEELIGLEKCLRFETERNARRWYVAAYIDCCWEIQAMVYRLN